MEHAKYWKRIDHANPRAVAMADRHYSRQSPGTPEFTGPGHKIVLLSYATDGTPAALWASHRPDPASACERADGLTAWDCSLFRVEIETVPAAVLIREAIAITKSIWAPIPTDGFITTINPKHVKPKWGGRYLVYGLCYYKAGWSFLRITQERNLFMLQLPADKLANVEPAAWVWDKPVFGNRRGRWNRPAQPTEQNGLWEVD